MIAAIGVLLFPLLTSAAPSDPPRVPEELEGRIAKLIKQLGAPSYVAREKAYQDLLQLGEEAFDALFAAQGDDDLEISMRARNLIRKLPISATREEDPESVRRLLRGYSQANVTERESRIRQLAEQEGTQGLSALCRLARFETSEILSKRAALALIQRPIDPWPAVETAVIIERQMERSHRTAGTWLRAYAATVREPGASVASWDTITQNEMQRLGDQEERTHREIVRDLLRWQASLLGKLDRRDDAVAATRRTINLLDGDRKELLETIAWLAHREAWNVVDEVAEKFQDRFVQDAELLYRLAESKLKQGKGDDAKRVAAQALALDADSCQRHKEVAFRLADLGLFDWCTAEYEKALAIGPTNSLHELHTRFMFSEMLHDQQKSLEAAKVLQVAVNAMDEKADVLELVQRMGREPNSIRSRMHFFYSFDLTKKGDREKAIDHIEKATSADATDADALIARYRVKNAPPQWHEQTVRMIKEAARDFRRQGQDLERQLEIDLDQPQREETERAAAMQFNQFAWLISNTEGDYDAAVQLSHRSLELRPNTAGYLDTLARCYYAKGDFATAIKYQQMALKGEPHSGLMQRQLDLFQKAQAEAKKNGERGAP